LRKLDNVKRPTYAQISKACGVNSSTVSRALNNHRSIPAATRRRIVAVARKMGWEPNPLAAAYMAHLRSTHPPSFKAVLGLVIDHPMPQGLQSIPLHLRRIHQGFERRAAEAGYSTQVFSLQDPEMNPTALDRTMFYRNIPGFAVTGLSRPGKVLSGLDWSRYAAVAMGYSLTRPLLHRVATNVMHGFKLVIEQVFGLGYRHVAVAVPREYDERTGHGVMFPVAYMRENCPPGHRLQSLVYDGDIAAAVPQIAAWLEAHRPQLAIGVGVFEAIRLLGWRIPQDIGFATFDRSPEYPDHAGLDQHYEVSGRIAADVVIAQVTQNRRGIPREPVEHLVKGRWLDGPSAPRRA
jgi:LacI family transcriptional regulator